jgi:hypothetical protein
VVERREPPGRPRLLHPLPIFISMSGLANAQPVKLFPPSSNDPSLAPSAVPYANLLGTWHVYVTLNLPPPATLAAHERACTGLPLLFLFGKGRKMSP